MLFHHYVRFAPLRSPMDRFLLSDSLQYCTVVITSSHPTYTAPHILVTSSLHTAALDRTAHSAPSHFLRPSCIRIVSALLSFRFFCGVSCAPNVNSRGRGGEGAAAT